MKGDETGRACSTKMGQKRRVAKFWCKNLKEGDH
jgi:hypothetical protein